MAVITISRQYGSGGDEVALRVCEMLGYQFFDKKLMAQVAAEAGLSEKEIIDFSEHNFKTQNFLDRLLGRPPLALPPGGEPARELNEEQSIAFVRGIILAAYRRGNVVIVGRGGQAVLKDSPGVLHVRIEAPLDMRVLRIQNQQLVSLAAAYDLAATRDKASAAYLKRYYGLDWADPLQYHLVINTGKWDIVSAARIIVNAVSNLPSAEHPA